MWLKEQSTGRDSQFFGSKVRAEPKSGVGVLTEFREAACPSRNLQIGSGNRLYSGVLGGAAGSRSQRVGAMERILESALD